MVSFEQDTFCTFNFLSLPWGLSICSDFHLFWFILLQAKPLDNQFVNLSQYLYMKKC